MPNQQTVQAPADMQGGCLGPKKAAYGGITPFRL